VGSNPPAHHQHRLTSSAARPPEIAASGNDDLTTVLSGLSQDHREVLLLRFVDGLSLEEISSAMDIPVGTVKSRLHNALKLLREDPRTRELFGE